MALVRETRELWRLAAPVVLTQLASMAMGVVDTLFAGRLGTAALAGVGVGHAYSFALLVTGMGIMMALDPLTSQAAGAGRLRDAGIALQRACVAAVLLAVPLLAAFWIAGPMLAWMGQPPEIVPTASAFVRAQSWSILPFLLYFAFRNHLQGRGIVRPALVIALAANGVNAAADWVCVYGGLGIPPLGAAGLGHATSASRTFLALGMAWVVFTQKDRAALGLLPSREALDLRAIGRFFAIGVPVGLQLGFEVWVFIGATLIAGRLGPAAAGGHQIALNLASLAFMVPLGIAIATSVRVGQAVGRGDEGGAIRACWTGYVAGLAVMGLSASLFALAPGALVSLYGTEADSAAVATSLLPIAAAFQLFDGAQVVGGAVLRGMADTRAAMWANLAGHWLIGLPVGWWLAFHAGAGVHGLWWGLSAGLAAVAVLLALRVRWRMRPGRIAALALAEPASPAVTSA